MSQPGDDAQRDLEQRALRNVRGLLDKMEDQDRKDNRTTLKIVLACGIVAVVVLALILGYSASRKEQPSGAIVLPPVKAPR